MTHIEEYLTRLSDSAPGAISSVKKTLADLVPAHISSFNFRENVTGLLLGEVQSGKTGQMFGIVAASADEGFEIFIVLTSPINALQKQTYERALSTLESFVICDETDEVRFKANKMRKPVLIVLKKNATVLKKWKDTLASSGFCKGRPIFIVDDEADSTSLNTMVNKEEQSSINMHLEHMRNLSTSSFYLQVTATPQPLLLQAKTSGWKPAFVYYFPPGKGYLGGSFFYSKPEPFTARFTDDDELTILLNTGAVSEGLKLATETYLITAADQMLKGETAVCNFLIHPSVRIDVHDKIAVKARGYVSTVLGGLDSDDIRTRLKTAWDDLKVSKPNIGDFRNILEYLAARPKINIYTMNSGPASESAISIDEGLNIVIGGNSLGRGVTFKGLQTVYYCRSSKLPQADTFWQHSRMFGYDRDPLLMRVFMPAPLFNMFAEINNSNEVLLKQIQEGELDKIQLMTTKGIRPTRRNVVDQNLLSLLVGNVNYFPPSPDQSNVASLDTALKQYDDKQPVYDVSLTQIVSIMSLLESEYEDNWSTEAFMGAIEAIKAEKGSIDLAKLIIRRDRNISKDTGTLLSVDDRSLGSSFTLVPVLTLYRLNGKTENKWDGNPFWVPNIKLPAGKVFYKVD